MKADIQLLFGVLGGGELSGASGKKIHGQLTNIANQINRNPFKIRFQAEEKSLERMRGNIAKILNEFNSVGALQFNAGGIGQTSNAFANITQNIGNTVSGLHQMNVELTKTNTEMIRNKVGGIGGLSETSINSIVSSLSRADVILTNVRAQVDNVGSKQGHIVSLTLQGENAAGQTSTRIMKIVQETGEVLKDVTDISAKLAEINSQTGQTANKAKGVSEGYTKAVNAIKEYYAELMKKGVIDNKNLGRNADGTFYSIDGENDKKQVAFLNQLQAEYNQAMLASTNFSETERKNLNNLNNEKIHQRAMALERLKIAEEKSRQTTVTKQVAIESANKVLGQTEEIIRKNSSAEKSRYQNSRKAYEDTQKNATALRGYIEQCKNGEVSAKALADETKRVSDANKSNVGIFKQNGDATKSWSDKLKGLAGRLSAYFGSYQIIMALYRLAQNMVKTIVEIDTAMTELKKVTDETDATYRKFLDNATARAKKLGATISDVITASADFARLGFNLEESEKLADAALVYKNVGDGIDDISTASESIIATMKAFGVEAKDVMTIVDKFNEVGNNYAISSKGVGDALLRSAAAMHSANNTLDQTIALATAANTVVQDPDSVGTTLKTVSMYLRAAKEEAESAGESIDGMASSTSELRSKILALTNGKVDIQIDDTTYKSTYEILEEISKVWNDINDVTRADILESVGGKRNANVVAAILENFEIAEKSLKTASNADGSALAENEKYMESIKGHYAELQSLFQKLSTTLIDTGFIKDIIDLGKAVLNIANFLAKIIKLMGGLNTVLYITVGLIATVKANSIKSTLIKGAEWITKITTALWNFVTGASAASISSQNGAITGSAFAAALEGVGISASMAQISMGAFVAVLGLALIALQSYKRKQEEARQAAEEATRDLTEHTNKLKEYKDTITELRSALDAGTLAENEAYDAKKQLVKIEQSLVDMYGLEAQGINLVTGEINEQKNAIDALNKTEMARYRMLHLNEINDATKLFTDLNPGYWDTDSVEWTYGDGHGRINIPRKVDIEKMFNELYPTSSDVETEEYINEYYDMLSENLQKAISGIDLGNVGLSNTGIDYYVGGLGSNIYDILESYESIYKVVEETTKYFAGVNYGQYVEDPLERMSNIISDIESNIKDNEDMFNMGVISSIYNTVEYYDVYSKAISAKSKYEEALLSGNEVEVTAAANQMQDIKDEFLKSGWSDEAVNLYMNRFFESFEKQAEAHKVTIKPELEKKSFKEVMSGIKNLGDGLDILGGIYSDIKDKGDFDWDSILDNEDFKNKFSSLGKTYDEFIKTVASSPKNIGACQSAFDKLATAYINNSGELENVTTETRSATIELLKQKGVANAVAVVDAQLEKNKAKLKYTTGEYADATAETYLELLNSAEITETYRLALLELAAAKILNSETPLSTEEDIKQLIRLAKAAGIATDSTRELLEAKGLNTEYDRLIESAEYYESEGLYDTAERYREQAEILLGAIKERKKDVISDFIEQLNEKTYGDIKIDYTPKDGEGETWFEKEYNKHQHLVAMEQETQKEYLDWLDKAYKKAYNEKIITLDDYRKYEEEVFEGLRELFQTDLDEIIYQADSLEKRKDTENKRVALYREAQNKILEEMQRQESLGSAANADYIKELKDQWWDLADNINSVFEAIGDKMSEKIEAKIKELEEENDSLNQEKSDWETAIGYATDVIESRIEQIQRRKEALEEENDEKERAIELEKLQMALENAKRNKNIRVYYEDKGFVWETDKEAISEAQKELDDFYKDEKVRALDEQIKYWEKEKDKWSSITSDYERNQNKLIAMQQFGYDITNKILAGQSDSLIKNARQHYTSVSDKIRDNEKEIKSLEELQTKTEEFVAAQIKFNDDLNSNLMEDANNRKAVWDKMILDAQDFVSRYNSIMSSMAGGDYASASNSATTYYWKGNKVDSATVNKWKNDGWTYVGSKNGGTWSKNGVETFASGTKNAPRGLAIVDEEGSEAIAAKVSAGRYTFLNGGEQIFTAEQTKRLWELVQQSPLNLFKNIGKALSVKEKTSKDKITPLSFNISNLVLQDVNNPSEFVAQLKRYAITHSNT